MNKEQIADELRSNTPQSLVEQLWTLYEVMERCQMRIKEEGEVVRNPRAEAIAHPSIKTYCDTLKLYNDIIAKYKK